MLENISEQLIPLLIGALLHTFVSHDVERDI